jgi:hypothetical protein
MNRVLSTLAVAALAAILPLEESAIAAAHRATLPAESVPYVYYLTTSGVPAAEREQLETAMRFALPSLSLLPVIDHQVPQPVGGSDTLHWIDTRGLGWEHSLPKVLKDNPYSYQYPSLVIRADWLIVHAMDASESEAYYDLLFGKAFGKRQEFIDALGLITDGKYSFGLIEGNSGVIVQKKRWMESVGVPRGYAWVTRDSAKINAASDPLNFPDGSFRHDAEEWIIGIPKLHAATGSRGALQVYFLADAAGRRQDKAPAELATDHTGVRYGATEVRNGVSCVACHVEGINPPAVNELRQLIESGVDVYAKKGKQEQLEAFHLGDVAREIERNNEDFAAAVEAACGCTPAEAVRAYVSAVRSYDADVTLERAAGELGVDSQEFARALAYASGKGLPARLAGLGHGLAIPRHTWEIYYLQAVHALKEWRAR